MDTFNSLKNELLKAASDMTELFRKAESVTGLSEQNFDSWEKACENIQKQLPKEILRIAAVGPIKSGKSTFVNALFRGDYLKRGAGVVTSIVTKLRRGAQLRATLYFKSWDEVNEEIQQALAFFPSFEKITDDESFDIRRKIDRDNLAEALNSLSSDQLITQSTRNVNSVILSSYLKGYHGVQNLLSTEGGSRLYEGPRFPEHRTFVGDEALSVYLRDISLEIDTGAVEENIEIADCQGSDSSNPLHLAMIQDYLLLTNMLVYVISSRTGLRQADIRFLSMIRQMGIMDNIIFVVNCDFSEHETIDGLMLLVNKIRDELSILKPNPDLFVFSALFNLFQEKLRSGNLSKKDRERFEQWNAEKELSEFSERETRRFEVFLQQKIINERYPLLLKNHLERLKLISSGMLQWTRLNLDIVEGDDESAGRIISNIHKNREKMNRVKSMVKSTLDGCVQKARVELRKDVDAFFEKKSGEVLVSIIEFIRRYSISFDQYEELLEIKGFTETLYAIYQEFRQALDNLMVETINPKIIGFIKSEEKKIEEIFGEIAGPFEGMVTDALAEYENTLGRYEVSLSRKSLSNMNAPDIESTKRLIGLRIPAASATMRYSARIKTEAVLRLGFYKILKAFKKLIKKPYRAKEDDVYQALQDGIRRMKRETENSIIFHFKNYRENIKFQYIFKLVDVVSNSYYEILLDRFQAYNTDLSELTDLIGEKRIDKERVYKILKEMETESNEMIKRMNRMDRDMTDTHEEVIPLVN
ncbi:MAG: dynamin family protein [Desulfobacterales bacterium]